MIIVKPTLEQRILTTIHKQPRWLSSVQNRYGESPKKSLAEPCLDGPHQISVNGKPKPFVQELLSLVIGVDFHRSWRADKICNGKSCVHPLHRRLTVVGKSLVSPAIPPAVSVHKKLKPEPNPEAPVTTSEIVEYLKLGLVTDPEELSVLFEVSVDDIFHAMALI